MNVRSLILTTAATASALACLASPVMAQGDWGRSGGPDRPDYGQDSRPTYAPAPQPGYDQGQPGGYDRGQPGGYDRPGYDRPQPASASVAASAIHPNLGMIFPPMWRRTNAAPPSRPCGR